jgi:hypothetical protein
MTDGEAELHDLLLSLDPKARNALRRILIHDQADRDAVSSQRLRFREGHGERLGRHRRHADDVSGDAAEGCQALGAIQSADIAP